MRATGALQDFLRGGQQHQLDGRVLLPAGGQQRVALVKPLRREAVARRQGEAVHGGRARALCEQLARRFAQALHGFQQGFRRLGHPLKVLRLRQRLHRRNRPGLRAVERVLAAQRAARLPAQPRKLIKAHHRGIRVAHAGRKLVRLVHQQARAARAAHQPVHRHHRVEHIVVIADDHVGKHRDLQRQLERADLVPLCQRRDLPAAQPLHAQRLQKRARQPVIKARREGAVLRAAVAHRMRADLVLRRDLRGHRVCTGACEQVHRVHGAAPARGARGQEHRAAAFALANGPERRIQRRHRLADARGRLRKEPLSVPKGDVHVRREFPLTRAVRPEGERQVFKRRIPRLPPRELPFLPGAGRRAERLKLRAQALPAWLLLVHRQRAAARVHIQHPQADRLHLRLITQQHVAVHRRLRPVRRNERLIRRTQLDLLDHCHAVLPQEDAVRAAANVQRQRFSLVVGGQRHFLSVFALLRAALPGAVRDRALLHPLRAARRRGQVALVQRRLHHGAHADAHNRLAHARLLMRRSITASTTAPSTDTAQARFQASGASYRTAICTFSPSGTP